MNICDKGSPIISYSRYPCLGTRVRFLLRRFCYFKSSRDHHAKNLGFKISVELNHSNRLDALKHFIMIAYIPYCVSLITVTITSPFSINIFQMVHFSAVKFTKGNEKNMSFLLISKSHRVWKNSEGIRLGTLIPSFISESNLSTKKSDFYSF